MYDVRSSMYTVHTYFFLRSSQEWIPTITTIYWLVYCVQCTPYTVLSSLYVVQCSVTYVILCFHWPMNIANTLTSLRWPPYIDLSTLTCILCWPMDIIHCVQCAVYTIHCIVYIIQCTLYTIQYTVYIIHCTLYNIQCTLYSIHCTQYIVQCTLYSIQCTLYSIHRTLSISTRTMTASTQAV